MSAEKKEFAKHFLGEKQANGKCHSGNKYLQKAINK